MPARAVAGLVSLYSHQGPPGLGSKEDRELSQTFFHRATGPQSDSTCSCPLPNASPSCLREDLDIAWGWVPHCTDHKLHNCDAEVQREQAAHFMSHSGLADLTPQTRPLTSQEVPLSNTPSTS